MDTFAKNLAFLLLMCVCIAVGTGLVLVGREKSQTQTNIPATQASQTFSATISDDGGAISLGPKTNLKNVLMITDLARDFEGAPFRVGTKRFGEASLAPSAELVAFTVTGHNDQLGVLDLRSGKAAFVTKVVNGFVRIAAWAPNSRYLVIQILPASGLDRLAIVDMARKEITETVFAETGQTNDPDLEIINVYLDPESRNVYYTLRFLSRPSRTFRYSISTGQTFPMP